MGAEDNNGDDDDDEDCGDVIGLTICTGICSIHCSEGGNGKGKACGVEDISRDVREQKNVNIGG